MRRSLYLITYVYVYIYIFLFEPTYEKCVCMVWVRRLGVRRDPLFFDFQVLYPRRIFTELPFGVRDKASNFDPRSRFRVAEAPPPGLRDLTLAKNPA